MRGCGPFWLAAPYSLRLAFSLTVVKSPPRGVHSSPHMSCLLLKGADAIFIELLIIQYRGSQAAMLTECAIATYRQTGG